MGEYSKVFSMDALYCVQSYLNNSSKSAHHISIHSPAMHAAKAPAAYVLSSKSLVGCRGRPGSSAGAWSLIRGDATVSRS